MGDILTLTPAMRCFASCLLKTTGILTVRSLGNLLEYPADESSLAARVIMLNRIDSYVDDGHSLNLTRKELIDAVKEHFSKHNVKFYPSVVERVYEGLMRDIQGLKLPAYVAAWEEYFTRVELNPDMRERAEREHRRLTEYFVENDADPTEFADAAGFKPMQACFMLFLKRLLEYGVFFPRRMWRYAMDQTEGNLEASEIEDARNFVDIRFGKRSF